jgi:hypothetical protein
MDCTRFENLMFESLDGLVTPADDKFMREHQHGCASCREFASMLRGDAETERVVVPADLIASIVESTSGSPCSSAQMRLAATDEGSAVDELLELHVAGCSECAAVSRALVHLRQELPSLASLDPGADFVASVMAATVGADASLVSVESMAIPAQGTDFAPAVLVPAASLWERFARTWQQLAQRPRFAMEGAYVAAVIAVLVLGLPTQSLADLPGRAFDGVRREGANVERALSGHIETIAELGKTTWIDSTSRAAELLSTGEGSDSAQAFAASLSGWAGTIRTWGSNAFGGLLAPLFDNIANFFNENSNPQPRSNQ